MQNKFESVKYFVEFCRKKNLFKFYILAKTLRKFKKLEFL